jgi:sugar fermentation stimulation protein A
MVANKILMPFPQPQHTAKFLRRPQRFLAEIKFHDGNNVVAYCANPGSMAGCLTPGSKALLWDSGDIKRKRRYTLRAIKFGGIWVGTDTHLSNRIVEEALKQKLIPGMSIYTSFTRERLLGEDCRVDFVLAGESVECLLEVKSVVVVEHGVARYPDCRTPRGVKQLKELTRQAIAGKRVVLLFLVQRSDAHCFVVSSAFDPTYATAFDEAVKAGVEIVALGVPVSPTGFGIPKILPYAKNLVASVDTSLGS